MSDYTTDTPSDYVDTVDVAGHDNSNGLLGTMANSAAQFGNAAGTIWNTANQYASSQGGWGNTLQNAASGYVSKHGGVVGTAEHLGHDVVNAAANTLWGAKDWGDAWRSASQGHWGDALKSAAWGAAAVGATASLALPGVGEVVKGGELAAQAARAGGEAVAKDAAEAGAKDAAEAGTKDAVEETSTTGDKARKAEKWANRARKLDMGNLDISVPRGQEETFTRAY
jgi:hypothetical protein